MTTKRILSLMLSLVLLCTAFIIPAQAAYQEAEETGLSAPPTGKLWIGDANIDSDVTLKDATAIQKHCAFITLLTSKGVLVADVNNDGEVSLKDATSIQKYCAQLITTFPAGETKDDPDYVAPTTAAPASTTAQTSTTATTTAAPSSTVAPTTVPASQIISIYFTNNNSWTGTIYAYAWRTSDEQKNATWPGVAATFVGNNSQNQAIYVYQFDKSKYDNIIFNNNSSQTVDIVTTSVTNNAGYYCLTTKNSLGHFNVSTYVFDPSIISGTTVPASSSGQTTTIPSSSSGQSTTQAPSGISGQGTLVTISSFKSTTLNNSRRIVVYLPPTYNTNTTKRYPVLYAQDGQNLFKDSEAFGGTSWGLKTALDDQINKGYMQEIIVVAIDNNSNRMSEYTPVSSSSYGGGNAANYMKFITTELKASIDSSYRTLTDAANTGIMGSSLGGLLALYAATNYSNYFLKIGALSPSVWWADNWMVTRAGQVTFNSNLRMWIDAGLAEETSDYDGDGLIDMPDDAREFIKVAMNKGMQAEKNILYYEIPGAQHNEASWKSRVFMTLQYMFGTTTDLVASKTEIVLPKTSVSANSPLWVLPTVTYDRGIKATPVWETVTSSLSTAKFSDWCKLVGTAKGSTTLTWVHGSSTVTKSLSIT